MGRSRLSRGHADGFPGNYLANKIPKLVFVTQPTATVTQGSSLGQVPVVQLQDQDGVNILAAGVLVTFGMGVTDLTTVTARTNANGQASPASFLVDEEPGVYAVFARADGLVVAFSSPVTVTPSNTAPTAVIANPANGFNVAAGTPVTLNPTGTFDAETGWVGTWSVLGPGGVVRFSFTGTYGNAGSHFTTWTPAITESVTVQFSVNDAADGSGLSHTAQVSGTVSAGSPAPPSVVETPNKPSNLVRIAELSFANQNPPLNVSQVNSTGVADANGLILGRWSMFESFSPQSDSASPASPPHYSRCNYNAGMPTGGTPRRYTFGGLDTAANWDEWYQAIWFRLPDLNLDGRWESPRLANGTVSEWKIFGFWTVGEGTPGINALYMPTVAQNANPQTGLASQWTPRLQMQNVSGSSSGGGTIVVGNWYRLELYMKRNTLGSSNGIARGWLTNLTAGGSPSQIFNNTSFIYQTATNPGGIKRWLYHPVWGGGGGGPAKARTDAVDIAHVYIAAAGQV